MTVKKIAMVNRCIADRLDNWSLCQRGRGGGTMSARETRRSSQHGGGGHTCMTAVVCNIMRAAAEGPKGGAASQAKLDFEDAATINRAWQRLGARHRLLLRDFYVLARPPHILCRELSIKHWPASHWNRELREAQQAIEDLTDN